MPYRRLPNTDASRIKAITAAINKSMKTHPNELAFSFHTLQKAKYFLPTYTRSLEHQKAGASSTTEQGSTYAHAFKKARLYVSHFIQVLNFCIAREEFHPEILEFYGLEKFGRKLPSLQTEEELNFWAKKIIEGEEERIKQGGNPILNPRIALVKISVEKYHDAQHRHNIYSQKNEHAFDYIKELRQQANEIILNIWNEVEETYKDLPANEKRLMAEEYGLKYVFRPSEKRD